MTALLFRDTGLFWMPPTWTYGTISGAISVVARMHLMHLSTYLFHCQLENCPSKVETNICFKCGSTEHTSQGCRKVSLPGQGKTDWAPVASVHTILQLTSSSPDEFPFAVCFICKQKGHLSRRCPDNPRGLYPDGKWK